MGRFNFEIQRISFITLIMFEQIGIFLYELFYIRNGVITNFFSINYSSLTNKRLYPKQCSLKCEEARTNLSAFSRILGEGGTRERDE